MKSPPQSPPAVAFVASLLPARFLRDHGAELNVRQIVVVNEIHARSYAYVARHIPGAVIARLQGNRAIAAAALGLRLLVARLTGRRVLFFHEACWPEFDLLVALIQPPASFYPQITLAGLEPVPGGDWPRPSGWAGVIQSLFRRRLLDMFAVYRFRRHSGQEGFDYLLAARNYPGCVRTFPLPPDGGAEPASATADDRRSVLFVVGADAVPDAYLREVYAGLIRCAQSSGYEVFIKEHPLFRLNLESHDCVVIDPALPVELLDDRFTFVVGIASTGILSVRGRKISIVRALTRMADDVKALRVEYLLSLPGARELEFVDSLDDVCQAFAAYQPA